MYATLTGLFFLLTHKQTLYWPLVIVWHRRMITSTCTNDPGTENVVQPFCTDFFTRFDTDNGYVSATHRFEGCVIAKQRVTPPSRLQIYFTFITQCTYHLVVIMYLLVTLSTSTHAPFLSPFQNMLCGIYITKDQSTAKSRVTRERHC
jgi:hypothetical protein